MKRLLLTFDYELFLGATSGPVEATVIAPTRTILKRLDERRWKGSFFVDTLWLDRLEEVAQTHQHAARDLKAVTMQLAEIVARGHDLFPHLHPHWLDARYDALANEWSLTDTTRYRFESLDEPTRTRVFDDGMRRLRSLTTRAIDAYRAGGWSIQPFASFRPHFARHGIAHEMSVIPGKHHRSTAHAFDFRDAPDRATYRFDDDVCVATPQGAFTEWTISTLRYTPLQKYLHFKANGLQKRVQGTRAGSTVMATTHERGDRYAPDELRLVASLEGLNPVNLAMYVAAFRRSEYLHFISHPKMLGVVELGLVRVLLAALARCGDVETDFRRMT